MIGLNLVVAWLSITQAVQATSRQIRNTGGSVIFEEAWTIPDLINVTSLAPLFGQTSDELRSNILDIHNQRLTFMNENDVDFMIISCAQPCVQGVSDPDEALTLSIKVSNILAAQISNNTERFGGFAALPMHNATVAAQELERAVTELGFLGAMLNDYQQSGSDDMGLIYYDQPEFDIFWKTVTELDVPVYFHPRSNVQQLQTAEFGHARWLEGPAQEFAVTLSNHILGIITNGVFDRFQTLKIIVGHLGERIPSDLFRIDQQLRRQINRGLPMLRNVSDYWKTNLYETTSGNFATDLLNFHIGQIGLDRILYSVDYPYVPIEEGAAWLQQLSETMNPDDFVSLKRGLAIELFKLNG